jgi:hypothetical protein
MSFTDPLVVEFTTASSVSTIGSFAHQHIRQTSSYCVTRENKELWVAELLRHIKDFTEIHLSSCFISFAQMLPLLRGQQSLKTLGFNDCLLFQDPEYRNVLLSPPRPVIKSLHLARCGLSSENCLLMAGFS